MFQTDLLLTHAIFAFSWKFCNTFFIAVSSIQGAALRGAEMPQPQIFSLSAHLPHINSGRQRCIVGRTKESANCRQTEPK